MGDCSYLCQTANLLDVTLVVQRSLDEFPATFRKSPQYILRTRAAMVVPFTVRDNVLKRGKKPSNLMWNNAEWVISLLAIKRTGGRSPGPFLVLQDRYSYFNQ